MNIFIINILEFNLEKNIVKVIIILSFAMQYLPERLFSQCGIK